MIPESASDEFIAELQAGLEGVTEGPWDYFAGNANGRGLLRLETSHLAPVAGVHLASSARGKQNEINFAHIARLSPDRIRAVLSRLANAERQVKELREALANLIEPDVLYDGNKIVLTCDSHSSAMWLVRDACAALEASQ